jgi:ketosteroid isomerase-like protein
MLGPIMLDPALSAAFEICLDALRRGDRAALEASLAPEAEGYSPLHGPLEGARPVGASLARLMALAPGLEIAPVRTFGEGPELAARAHFRAAGRETDGILAFRFDPSNRITRLLVLFDPARVTEGPEAILDHRREARLVAYFRTYNADDEDGHMALISPDLVYFGSVSRMTAEGLDTARGIFQSAHARMGLKRFDPLRLYAGGDHAAALVQVHGSRPGGPTEEGVWVFRFDAEDRINRVSVLWNPGALLAWPSAKP